MSDGKRGAVDDGDDDDGLLDGDDGNDGDHESGNGSNGQSSRRSGSSGGRGILGCCLPNTACHALTCVGVAFFLVMVLVFNRSRVPPASGGVVNGGANGAANGGKWVSPSWSGPPSGGPMPGEPAMTYAQYLEVLNKPPAGDTLKPTPEVGAHDQWVVITSINMPTEAITKLAELGDWHIVIVADLKSPASKDFIAALPEELTDRIHVMTNDMQSKEGWVGMSYETTQQVPNNHYTRKNLGYLYAIQHGAKTIYETDDDNIILPALQSKTAFRDYWLEVPVPKDKPLLQYCLNKYGIQLGDGSGRGVVSRQQKLNLPGRIVINPYAHFGQPSVWPRGYPLEFIDFSVKSEESILLEQKDWEKSAMAYTYEECTGVRPLVQQGLANGDPDVDAVFRLTRRFESKIDIAFDSSTPPVMYPRGLMTPFNSQHTLFHYDAFFGLLIPKTTSFRVCDIWRGYWTQRLIWEVGGELTFVAPGVYQDRNVHNYLKDFIDERALYDDAGRLVRFLLGWKPLVTAKAGDITTQELFPIVLQLSYDMAREGFWEFGDVELVVAWLRDLKRVGYNPPVRVVFNPDKTDHAHGEGKHAVCKPHKLTDDEVRRARLEIAVHEGIRRMDQNGKP